MKTFKCYFCTKEFVSELTLQQHKLSKHDSDNAYSKSFEDMRSTSTVGSTAIVVDYDITTQQQIKLQWEAHVQVILCIFCFQSYAICSMHSH